ncbi:hypothetical protein JTB14_013038 [Gonioctena quinquepunctata]|nr:hypothetical protein JTB14_013038 [Gonioctena quinquepunctata]
MPQKRVPKTSLTGKKIQRTVKTTKSPTGDGEQKKNDKNKTSTSTESDGQKKTEKVKTTTDKGEFISSIICLFVSSTTTELH